MVSSTSAASGSEKKFIVIIWLLYVLVAVVTMIQHEPWRDEWQAWLIVQDSSSLGSLFEKLHYEGHPALWYLILWIVQLFTNDVAGMQIVHLVIAASSALLWLWYAPFTKLQRALFLFGYFPLYEYAVISRNYSLGLFFLLLFLVSYTRNKENYIRHSIFLALMMQTNLLACVFACGLASGLYFKKLHQWRKLITPTIILFAGMFLFIIVVAPAKDHQFGKWMTSLDINQASFTFSTFGNSLFPVPNLVTQFWNTNITGTLHIPFILAVSCIIITVVILRPKLWVLITLIITLIVLLSVLYMRHLTNLRHTGHMYLLVVACIWLYRSGPKNKQGYSVSVPFRKLPNILITALFSIHVFAAGVACTYDWTSSFTSAKEVAAYIKNKNLQSFPFAGEPDFVMSSVSGYLNRPIYHLRTKEERTYATWNKKRWSSLSEQEILYRIREYTQQQNTAVLLLLSYRIQSSHSDIQLINQFEKSIVYDEVYFLYRVNPK